MPAPVAAQLRFILTFIFLPAVLVLGVVSWGSAAGGAAGSSVPLLVDQGWYYAGLNSASMVSTGSDGNLDLAADRSSNPRYYSSEVDSDYFTGGTVSVRAKMSAGIGMWPAIWMVPKTQQQGVRPPEIDMVEVPQATPGQTSTGHFTYHWTDSSGQAWQDSIGVKFASDLTTSYHTYTLNWAPGSLTFFVDGTSVLHVESDPARSTGVFAKIGGNPAWQPATPSSVSIYNGPMRLRINNGVGSPGSWAGTPDSTTPFPNTLQISSVTVQPTTGPTVNYGTTGQFSYTTSASVQANALAPTATAPTPPPSSTTTKPAAPPSSTAASASPTPPAATTPAPVPKSPISVQPTLDAAAIAYKSTPSTTLSRGSVSTSGPGELLLAFVQGGGPDAATQTVRSVTGANLTWTRASFANPQGGGANEVWQAWASAQLTNATVTATFGTAADGMLSVESFKNAAHSLGAVGAGSQPAGPNDAVTIKPTSSRSLIVGGGSDWTSSSKAAPGAGQSLTTYVLIQAAHHAYWTQSVGSPTVAGMPVSVNATVPGSDCSSIVAVEVPPAS